MIIREREIKDLKKVANYVEYTLLARNKDRSTDEMKITAFCRGA
jgi:hypothetical protein